MKVCRKNHGDGFIGKAASGEISTRGTTHTYTLSGGGLKSFKGQGREKKGHQLYVQDDVIHL